MALAIRCDNGHSYVAGDIYLEWPEGKPHCPECAAEWQRGQDAKQEIKIEDLQRVRLAPGDVLVIRYEQPLPEQDQARVLKITERLFPDNKILVMGGGAALSVIEASD